MNPLTRLYRHSRAFRVLTYLFWAVLWVMIAFVSIGSFTEYSQAGNVTVLIGLMLVAAFAWWYGEDRDRRQASRAADATEAESGARDGG